MEIRRNNKYGDRPHATEGTTTGIQEGVEEDPEAREILDIERRSRSTLGLRWSIRHRKDHTGDGL